MTMIATITAWALTFAALAAPAQAEYYICPGEESLAEIAELTGADPELLAAANGRELTDKPEAGAWLSLPMELALAVTVRSGDTVCGLARDFGLSVGEILAYNEDVIPERLQIGQVIYLPLDEEAAIGVGGAEIVAVTALARRSLTLEWPAEGIITSLFGEERAHGYHSGLDVANEAGMPVMAAAAGRVIEAGWKNDAYGWTIMLDHGEDMHTLYAHCSRLLVDTGQQVRAGETLAVMGSTGNSTGPHVHFEVRIDGCCQDPLTYLEAR